MGRFNWGREGPPDEAYSRVTEPERFLPLVEWSLDMLSRLEAEYDVRREEGYDLDSPLERTPPTRPTIKLTPRRDASAPIAVAFHDLPGIRVRFGHYLIEPFPDCACDACDECAEGEFQNFKETEEAVVAGHFRKWFRLLPDGSGQVGREFFSDELQSRGWSRVEPGSVRSMATGRITFWSGCRGHGGRRSSDRDHVRGSVLHPICRYAITAPE